jgi:uncharacterized membrane protein
MVGSKEIRTKALSQLKGHWTEPVVFTLLYMLILIAISALSGRNDEHAGLSTVIQLLVMGPVTYGVTKYFLSFKREEAVDNSMLLAGFKKFTKTFTLYLLMSVKTFLWTLLFIIPGIIAIYRYSMAYFLMIDHPELSANELLAKSSQLMDGYKWKLFVLQLSFIGWQILAIFTLGIGFLWLQPYMAVSQAHFYDMLKEEHKKV